MNQQTEWHQCSETGKLVCSNGGKMLPKLGQKGWGKIRLDTKDLDMDTDDQIPLIDAIPDQLHRDDINDEDGRNVSVDRSLLSYVSIDQSDAIELESTNANTDHWREEIDSFEIRDYETTIEQDIDNLEVQIVTQYLLEMLKTDKHTNTKGQWDNRTDKEVKTCLSSEENISKLRDVELRVIVRFLKRTCKAKIIESESKKSKVEKLSRLLGLSVEKDDDKQEIPKARQRKLKSVGKLADIAFDKLSKKVPKQVLNITMSEFYWQLRLK